MSDYHTLLKYVSFLENPQVQQIGLDSAGYIIEITERTQNTYKKEINLEGNILTQGGIDLQINGGLGLAFPDLQPGDEEKLGAIASYLWNQGVDGFCPTIVTTSIAKIQQSLKVINNFIKNKPQEETARILGVHLEGPFLNFQKRGAHPAEYLLPLSVENLEQVVGDYKHIIKIITLAPELDATSQVIAFLVNAGITVSLGHSLASASEAKKAFEVGANMVTHAFNAMPSLHHREPGLLGEAIVNNNVYSGLIADGQHICPTMIKILLQASNFRVFLVSDALAPLGLGDGVYPWDSREIEVKKGTAFLADGTLSGTTLPLLVGVQNLVKWGICGVEEAIALATENPRKALGMSGINLGEKANFLVWSKKGDELIWKRLKL